MKAIFIRQIAAILISAMLFTSCKVTQDYDRPALQTDSLYHGASAKDTNNIFGILYPHFFKDRSLQPLLQGGIRNNYNLKIAAASARRYEAVFTQNKTAFF